LFVPASFPENFFVITISVNNNMSGNGGSAGPADQISNSAVQKETIAIEHLKGLSLIFYSPKECYTFLVDSVPWS
jgi:hypothetical protein